MKNRGIDKLLCYISGASSGIGISSLFYDVLKVAKRVEFLETLLSCNQYLGKVGLLQ